jgi:Tol biopolymer transport system component
MRSGDLYVASPGQEPLRLTRGAGARRPAWSADGRWVSYHTGDQLWIASADGRHVQRVWEPGLPVGASAWAPLTSTLAFVARGGLQVVEVGPGGAGKPREVHIPVSEFAWAPDGERFVVVEPYGGPWPGSRGAVLREGLALVELKTGQFRDLIRFPLLDESGQTSRRPAYTVANLTWSPDGRWVAFHKLGPSSSLNADGTTLAVIPTTGGKVIDVATMLAYPDWVQWRPDSQVLGYIAGSGRDVWQGKELRLGYPPAFASGGRVGPIGVTPPGYTDVGSRGHRRT